MDIQHKVPWSSLLWTGISECTGEIIKGQLFRIKDDYYINRPYRQGFFYNMKDDGSIITIEDWHKIIPSTLERVAIVVADE